MTGEPIQGNLALLLSLMRKLQDIAQIHTSLIAYPMVGQE
jgi:hypothetical protein